MSSQVIPQGLLPTNLPDLFFEDNAVGRMKKEVWDASDAEIDAILAEYGVPSPVEGQARRVHPDHDPLAGREESEEERHRLYPGRVHRAARPAPPVRLTLCTSARSARGCAVSQPNACGCQPGAAPLNYGAHPYHHLGMPGTVIVREHVVREMMIDVMLGLWNDGFRKQLIVNNHGQLWVLESAVQEFQKRYQLPAFSG